MTVLEIRLDDEIAKAAERVAAARGETLEQMLARMAEETARKQDRKALVARLRQIGDEAKAEVGPITWTRDDLYER